MYGSLTFLPQSNFAVFDDWCFLQYCLQRTKIVQIAQLNQLFQLLHLVHIYGYGFYELSRMIMRKNVNNDVRKDSPCPQRFAYMSLYVLLGVLIWSVVPVNHRRGDWTWKSAKINWKKKKNCWWWKEVHDIAQFFALFSVCTQIDGINKWKTSMGQWG